MWSKFQGCVAIFIQMKDFDIQLSQADFAISQKLNQQAAMKVFAGALVNEKVTHTSHTGLFSR